MTDVLIVVDMQVGPLDGPPKHDLPGVLDRINCLAAHVRARSGRVIYVRHRGPRGDAYEPGSSAWQFLPELVRHTDDIVVAKTLNDPFCGTDLKAILDGLLPERLLVTGWATDFCVDSTVRSAVSNGQKVVVVADGHTVGDRPHLDARSVIRHHNWVWKNLIAARPVELVATDDLLAGFAVG
jgi:nicotinamidase-related amidase